MIRLVKPYFLPGAVFVSTLALLVSVFFAIDRSPYSNYALETVLAAGILKEFSKMYVQRTIVRLRTGNTGAPVISTGPNSHRSLPPRDAEFLFYLFMTPQNCDAIVGDVEERYKLICKKFGKRRANFWYWTQTVCSLGPIVWAWAKKSAVKPVTVMIGWAMAKGLLGHDSWIAAVVELLKRVRS